jgi:hypothetical protein
MLRLTWGFGDLQPIANEPHRCIELRRRHVRDAANQRQPDRVVTVHAAGADAESPGAYCMISNVPGYPAPMDGTYP